jgi:hypothetical protein
MVPSMHTLEAATRARMADRAYEAEQYRLVRLARQSSPSGRQDQAIRVSTFAWLRQLSKRVFGATADVSGV